MTDCVYFLLYLALGKLSLMLLINYYYYYVKVSTTQKSLNHHEKASTPTLKKIVIFPKILNPLCKFFNSLEVT